MLVCSKIPCKKKNTVDCGLFQIYFYENFHNYKKLINEALETLFNELYSLDQEKKMKKQ